MKLVESKKEEITIDEVIDRFNELIVSGYDRESNRLYILTKFILMNKTVFMGNDFKNETSWGAYDTLGDGLYRWTKSESLDVQVFETYKEFIEWVGELPLDK